jgi:branched-chain amino acid transport system ATP-binding protein
MNDDIPALATCDLTISFGGQVAVNAVTCAFRQGTLTAIVGPNGAGKTTYFNLISGQLQPSNGSVSLFGADITRFGAPQRARRGLGRAFQLTNLYPNLSVFENVRLAVQSVAQIRFDLLSIAARNARLREEAVHWLDRVKLTPRAALPAAALSHGDQRKLEVAILLALKPRVFMFDEPTAGMSLDEVPVILDLIDEIKLEGDKTVLLVERRSHRRAPGRRDDRGRPAGGGGGIAGGAAGLSRNADGREAAARGRPWLTPAKRSCGSTAPTPTSDATRFSTAST